MSKLAALLIAGIISLVSLTSFAADEPTTTPAKHIKKHKHTKKEVKVEKTEEVKDTATTESTSTATPSNEATPAEPSPEEPK
jgi:cytoskeletal protein RodZ